jgi:hypothetical protein
MSRSRRRSIGTFGGIVLVCCAVGAVAVTAQAGQGPPLWAGPAGGIVPIREPGGQGKPGGGGARPSKQLTYHNGPVITSATTAHAIFWGDWSAPGDKITGIDSFYTGVGSSGYMNTNTEYTQTGGGHVTSAFSYVGHVSDASATPSTAPSTADVLAVVARNFPQPTSNGYYPVYSDQPRGTAGYCAWHSTGTINGTRVQFAFFFKLDGDAGCDPKDTTTTHSEGLAALANVSGHELSEMVTDPQLNAWYDVQGAENADKCAWTFGTPTVSFSNNTVWKVQMNWSNAASGCIQKK